MNQITKAFVAAGVRAPTQAERLWTVVRDHGPITSKLAASKCNLPLANTNPTMSQLEQRGMVVSTKQRMWVSAHMQRMVKLYTVKPGMKTYELLPVIKRKVKLKAWPVAVQPQPLDPVAANPYAGQPAPAPLPAPPAPTSHAQFDVSTMPVDKAFALYRALRPFFEGTV